MLRLPGELRRKIWAFAFGNCLVDVSLCHGRFRYDVYEDEISRRNRSAINTRKLVCHQFLDETTHALISTSSFKFDSAKTFYRFVLSKPQIIPYISKLRVWCRVTNVLKTRKNYIVRWAEVLTSSFIGRFKSLRNLTLTLAINLPNGLLVRDLNVMGSYNWKSKKLPSLLRAFQQHALSRDGTTASVEYFTMAKGNGGSVVPLEKAIRDELLRYRKSRVSKRKRKVRIC